MRGLKQQKLKNEKSPQNQSLVDQHLLLLLLLYVSGIGAPMYFYTRVSIQST